MTKGIVLQTCKVCFNDVGPNMQHFSVELRVSTEGDWIRAHGNILLHNKKLCSGIIAAAAIIMSYRGEPVCDNHSNVPLYCHI